MTTAVRNLLDSFNTLSDGEKHEAALEILKRAGESDDVPAAVLCEMADELFQTMDQSEAENAKP
jgi:hypothetical protein